MTSSWNWSLPTAAALLSQRPLTCCGLAPLAVRRSWSPEFPQFAHLGPKWDGFADHYPYEMAISLGILTQHFQTNPNLWDSLQLAPCDQSFYIIWVDVGDVLPAFIQQGHNSKTHPQPALHPVGHPRWRSWPASCPQRWLLIRSVNIFLLLLPLLKVSVNDISYIGIY